MTPDGDNVYDFQEKLSKIGISETLYRLYVAAIELGEAPISDVAARAGLVRTTAYDALARLEEEGLVRIAKQGVKRIVIAEDPTVLLELLEARRQMLGEVMPELRSLYNRAKGKPRIRYYEGGEGIKTALWDTLTVSGPNPMLYGILSMDELREVPGLAEMDRFIAARAQKGIWLRVIRSREKDVGPIWPTSKADLRDLRFSPEDYLMSMTTFVYDSRVCLISSARENYGMVIESEEFATMQRQLFQSLWAMSSPT